MALYQEALAVVRVLVGDVFVNCSRYIPTFQRVAASPYIPRPGRATPIPDWKRKEVLRDVLPERDKRRLAEDEALGG
jgi:hypothetical protein